VTIFVKAL